MIEIEINELRSDLTEKFNQQITNLNLELTSSIKGLSDRFDTEISQSNGKISNLQLHTDKSLETLSQTIREERRLRQQDMNNFHIEFSHL